MHYYADLLALCGRVNAKVMRVGDRRANSTWEWLGLIRSDRLLHEPGSYGRMRLIRDWRRSAAYVLDTDCRAELHGSGCRIHPVRWDELDRSVAGTTTGGMTGFARFSLTQTLLRLRGDLSVQSHCKYTMLVCFVIVVPPCGCCCEYCCGPKALVVPSNSGYGGSYEL